MEIGVLAAWLVSLFATYTIGESAERTKWTADTQIIVNEVQLIRQLVRFVGYTYASIEAEQYFPVHEWVRHVMQTVEDVDRMIGALLVRFEYSFGIVPEISPGFPLDLGHEVMDWIIGTGDWDDLYDLFQ